MPTLNGLDFVDKKSIPITWNAPTAKTGTLTNQAATYDNRLIEGAADTVYNDYNQIQSYSAGFGDLRTTLTFDVNAIYNQIPAGATWTAKLVLTGYGYGAGSSPNGRTYYAYKITQTGMTEAACWNHYVGTTHWVAAGGDYVTINPTGGSCTVVGDGTGEQTWNNMAAIVQDAIDTMSGIVRVVLMDSSENSATQYQTLLRDRAYATVTARPKIVIEWTVASGDVPVPNPYTVLIDMYKGDPSITEDVTGWTVNSRVFHNRYPISVKAFTAITNADTVVAVIDTKSMVDAVDSTGTTKFFVDGDAAVAYTVEFALEVAGDKTTNDCWYWTDTALGVPGAFNTPGTRYYIQPKTTMAANTDHTIWMYFDRLRDGETSSNYSAAETGIFFTDFATASANLAAFETNYPLWSQDTTNAPTAVVASSVLTITGNADATWRGVATDATIGTDFHAIFRLTAAPGAGFACGIFDAAGVIAAANKDGMALFNSDAHFFGQWNDDTDAGRVMFANAYPTAPFSIDICKYQGSVRFCMIRDDPDKVPATYNNIGLGEAMRQMTVSNVAMKLFIASKAATGGSVDSVFCYNELQYPPLVKAPAVTYLKPGAVFGGDCHINFPYDTAFALSNGTELYVGSDPMVQLTSDPGATAQLAVAVPDIDDSPTIYCYIGQALITQYTPHAYWSNAGAWDEYDSLLLPPAWSDDTDYIIGDRVEGTPTGVREGLSTGADAGLKLYGAVWGEQSFTASANYTITSAKLLLYRTIITGVGTITVGVRAVDVDHKPTGADLCSGTYNGNLLNSATAGAWITFSFGAGTALTSGTEYSLVVRATAGTSNKAFYWKYDTGAGYASGQYGTSANSGSTWTLDVNRDFMFETFGGIAQSNTAYTCAVAHNSGDYADFDEALVDGAWTIDWTEETGTWTLDPYQQAVINQSATGNIGASPGRAWVRYPNLFTWNSKYYMISNHSLWEAAGQFWPVPYTSEITEHPEIGEPGGVPVRILADQEDMDMFPGSYPSSVYVDGTYPTGAIYCGVECTNTAGAQCLKIWKCTGANPLDPDNWTAITGMVTLGAGYTHQLYKRGSTWYAIIAGVYTDGSGHYCIQERHTDVAPESWATDGSDFSAAATMIDTNDNVELEDLCFATDSVTNITYCYVTYGATPYIRYWYIDEDGVGHAFPGNGHWTGGTGVELPFDKASWGNGYWGSPRVYNNISVDGYLYLFNHAKPVEDTTEAYWNRWCPNWIQVCRSTSFTDFTLAGAGAGCGAYNTKYKYKQADATGIPRTYKTGSSLTDCSVVAEVQVSNTGVGGVLFRNDDTNNNGYLAGFHYSVAGTSYVKLYVYTANAIVGSTYLSTYTIPIWPDAGALGAFRQNTPWRIRVDAYGTSIKVYFSRWGGPWVLAHTTVDETYPAAGTVGAGFYLGTGAINEWKARKIVSPEPTVGQYANVGGAAMMLSGNF